MTDKELEKVLQMRLRENYDRALKTIIKRNKAFLKLVEDVESGKVQPPQYYIDTDQVERWRQGFLQEALRRNQVEQRIADDLKTVGEESADDIRSSTARVFERSRLDTIKTIKGESDIHATFAQYDKRQLEAIVTSKQSPFSKIAYHNLGNNPKVVRRLQNELMQAIILGEGRRGTIKRIRDVVGNAQYNAERTAQTERVRVQSQGRQMAMDEATDLGIRMAKKWSTKMDGRERDSHGELDQYIVMEDEPFPNGLMYPGDPAGSAEEVINCRCVLVPIVLLPDETVEDGRLVKRARKTTSTENHFAAYGEPPKDRTDGDGGNRDEIYKHFEKIGFSVGASVDKVDAEILSNAAGQLEKLETKFRLREKFGLCGTVDSRETTDYIMMVNGNIISPRRQTLTMSLDWCKEGLSEKFESRIMGMINSGSAMPALENNAKIYVVTHEYGHMLENFIMHKMADLESVRNNVSDALSKSEELAKLTLKQETLKVADRIRDEIVAIAKKENKRLKLVDCMTERGLEESTEFFAEAFANSQLGRPNAIGRALNTW